MYQWAKKNTRKTAYLFFESFGDVREAGVVDVVVSDIQQTQRQVVLQQISQLNRVGRLKAIVREIKLRKSFVHLHNERRESISIALIRANCSTGCRNSNAIDSFQNRLTLRAAMRTMSALPVS